MSLKHELIKLFSLIGKTKTTQYRDKPPTVKEIDRFYQIKMFFILLLIITATLGFYLISINDRHESAKDVYVFFGIFVVVMLWSLFVALILIRYAFKFNKKLITTIGVTEVNARYINIGICAFFLIIATYGLLHSWSYNSLKSDEEMLAHFEANRTVFETLTSEYRNLPDDPKKDEKYEWESANKIKSIKQKLAIEKINESSPHWLPNPYSIDAIHRLNALINTQSINHHQVSTVEISLKDRPESWSLLHLKFRVQKSYVHVPVEPKIEQSHLFYPWIFTVRQVGKKYEMKTYFDVLAKPAARLLDSLDGYPSNWERGECIFKRIDGEAQWFLRMCSV